jgi:bifunctional non-homologous end joining protein LigD
MSSRSARFEDSGEPIRVQDVPITHPDRVYFAEPKVTKADLVDYLVAVRSWLEPHVVGRPVMLLRCPEGLSGSCFFQRHPTAATSRAIGRAALERTGAQVLVLDSYRSVVAAAASGALELHIWGSRADRPSHPDRMVFDLDPGEDVGFEQVKEAAVELAEGLDEGGLTSFVMTTGSKGLHLVVPLTRHHEFAEVRDHARAWAHALARERPDRYTDHPNRSARRGHVYIDVLRNGRGATAICPWSTRARPGAPVATPIDWEALALDFHPSDLTLPIVLARQAKSRADPWDGYFDVSQRITKATWAAISAVH